jgi:hypothetical protein
MRRSNWLGVGAAALLFANGAIAQDAEVPPTAPVPKTAAELNLERLKVEQGIAEAEEVKRARDRSCLQPREVRGVRKDGEEHVGGTEDAGAMTVNGDVTKETVEAF